LLPFAAQKNKHCFEIGDILVVGELVEISWDMKEQRHDIQYNGIQHNDT
jgi:hypothetical protein